MGNESIYFNNQAYRVVEKSVTFVGGTINAIGDYDGTGDPFTIFTVSGAVKIRLYAICTTSLVGTSATIEIGVSGDTAEIIAQTTATDIDANELWHDATPDSGVETASDIVEKIIVKGLDIIGNIGTANITAGVIKFVCEWRPISNDGNVVAA